MTTENSSLSSLIPMSSREPIAPPPCNASLYASSGSVPNSATPLPIPSLDGISSNQNHIAQQIGQSQLPESLNLAEISSIASSSAPLNMSGPPVASSQEEATLGPLSLEDVSPSNKDEDGSEPQDMNLPRDMELVDDENPGVNLHDFLIRQLREQKDRVFLLKLEEELIRYVQDPNRNEQLRLPRYSSYHRMLAHRVAAYFGLIHNVDPFEKTCVVVSKGPNTRIPETRFVEHIPNMEDMSDGSEPKAILRRHRDGDTPKPEVQLTALVPPLPQGEESRSIEQRERAYEEAKARIFNNSEVAAAGPEKDEERCELEVTCAPSEPTGSPVRTSNGSSQSHVAGRSGSFKIKQKSQYNSPGFSNNYYRDLPTQMVGGNPLSYWGSPQLAYQAGMGMAPYLQQTPMGSVYFAQPSPQMYVASPGPPSPSHHHGYQIAGGGGLMMAPITQQASVYGSPNALAVQSNVSFLGSQMESLNLKGPQPPSADTSTLVLQPAQNQGVFTTALPHPPIEEAKPTGTPVGATPPAGQSTVYTQQNAVSQVKMAVRPASPTIRPHPHISPYYVNFPTAGGYPNTLPMVASGNQYQGQTLNSNPVQLVVGQNQLFQSGQQVTLPRQYIYQPVPGSPVQPLTGSGQPQFFPNFALQGQGSLYSPPAATASGFMGRLFSPPPTAVLPQTGTAVGEFPGGNIAQTAAWANRSGKSTTPPQHTVAIGNKHKQDSYIDNKGGSGNRGNQGGGTHQAELPPRFLHQNQQTPTGGMRYQQHRHPSNRSYNNRNSSSEAHLGPATPPSHPRKEGLLPTPTGVLSGGIIPVVTQQTTPGSVSMATSQVSTFKTPKVVKACLEFECNNGEERSALVAEIKNSRQANKILPQKDTTLRVEYCSVEHAQATLQMYQERKFNVVLHHVPVTMTTNSVKQ